MVLNQILGQRGKKYLLNSKYSLSEGILQSQKALSFLMFMLKYNTSCPAAPYNFCDRGNLKTIAKV